MPPNDPQPVPPGSSGQELPPGTRLEEFVIERVLGSGGFGITYLAKDARLGRQVVIKENLPVQFCFRDSSTSTVRPRQTQGEDVENFKWSLENFEKEATMLASLDHPGIVRVLRSFEANGTAYFAMPFIDGTALDEQIKGRVSRGNAFTEEELFGLLWRMLDALDYLHARGIYHRDIKPGNILITHEGIPVLIDFGSARQRLSERSLTVMESAGYTPFEQLQTRGKIGPWSDLYALGATLYKVITGETPPKSTDRAFDDPMVSLASRTELRGRYSMKFLKSIDHVLEPRPEGRYRDAGQWRDGVWEKQKTAESSGERSTREVTGDSGVTTLKREAKDRAEDRTKESTSPVRSMPPSQRIPQKRQQTPVSPTIKNDRISPTLWWTLGVAVLGLLGRLGWMDYIKIEAERVEATRVEATRVEVALAEVARVEAARVEAARVEAKELEEARTKMERAPLYSQKLIFASRQQQDYTLKFSARPDEERFQIMRMPSVKWPDRQNFLLKVGEISRDEQFRVESVEEKTERNASGVEVDATEATITYLPKQTNEVLVRNVEKVIPTYFAEMKFELDPQYREYVKEGDAFNIAIDPDTKYRVVKVNESSVLISYQTGSEPEQTVEILKK